MSSKTQTSQVDQLLQHLTEALNQSPLSQTFSKSFDPSAMGFECSSIDIQTAEQFHQVLADFVTRLYREGLACPVMLTHDQALAEGLQLLEQAYLEVQGSGYDHALLEAIDPIGPGIKPVLARLIDVVKQQQQTQHTENVLATHIDSSNWALRCALTRHLMERLRPWLSQSIAQCPPEQMIDLLPQLLSLEQDIDHVLGSQSSA